VKKLFEVCCPRPNGLLTTQTDVAAVAERLGHAAGLLVGLVELKKCCALGKRCGKPLRVDAVAIEDQETKRLQRLRQLREKRFPRRRIAAGMVLEIENGEGVDRRLWRWRR